MLAAGRVPPSKTMPRGSPLKPKKFRLTVAVSANPEGFVSVISMFQRSDSGPAVEYLREVEINVS